MSERSYAVIGTGALGGFYGARLNRAGCEVHYLLRSDYEHVRARGLKCESKDGDFELPKVHAYRDVRDMPRCDVVLVGLKTTMNHLLGELLPGVVADDGVVLMMQNGLGMEDAAAAVVGADRVMGGMAFLCCHKVGPGHVRHLDFGPIALAEYDAAHEGRGVTDRLRAVGGDFERAGISVTREGDLVTARWKKLVWNVPFNGLSVVMGLTTDRIMADASARGLVEALMGEVVAGAAGHGRTVEPAFVAKMLSWTERMVAYKPSMMLDAEAGRAMEVETLFGNPVRAARAVGVEMGRVEMLYQLLKVREGVG
ncbi:MAG: 2-dehydropantoate 2-reductase [Planctomycetaceae bacterium]|nr:2-dehydropantoate 2-reductase [Planctomycetaceae bacterium]